MRKLALAFSTAALVLSGAAAAQTAPAQERTTDRAPRPDMTRAQAQAKAEAAFARMDANRDGTLDQTDRTARRAGMFDRMDADKNGSISRAEFDAMQAKRGAEGGKARGGHRMGARHGQMGGKMGARSGADRAPVTRQAFIDRALTMFDRADADRNGTVTQAERNAARATMRQQWRANAAQRQQG